MLTMQYGYCKLIFTDGFIVIKNSELMESNVSFSFSHCKAWERNIQDYNPTSSIKASLYYNIPFIISRCLETKIIYKWDIYRELKNFNHKTAFELYELIKDYIDYCNNSYKLNPQKFSFMRYCYIEGIENNLFFIVNILESKFPSLRMEYKLRKW